MRGVSVLVLGSWFLVRRSGSWFGVQVPGSAFRFLVRRSGSWFVVQVPGSAFRSLVRRSGSQFWRSSDPRSWTLVAAAEPPNLEPVTMTIEPERRTRNLNPERRTTNQERRTKNDEPRTDTVRVPAPPACVRPPLEYSRRRFQGRARRISDTRGRWPLAGTCV
jgi:hypothetical protein